MLLQPLAQVLIYSLVLSRIMVAKLPGIDSPYSYSIYLLAGMQAWSLFSEIVTRSMTVFVENGGMLKKIVFPRACLPIITLGSAFVNNLLLFVVMMIVFAMLRHFPIYALLWVPLLMFVTAAFSLGLGLLLGVLNVFVRDVAQFMMVMLQLWFWLTPVVYMSSIIPERLHTAMQFNPMYWVVAAYQDVLVYERLPEPDGLLGVTAAALALLTFSIFLFRRAAPDMVDVL